MASLGSAQSGLLDAGLPLASEVAAASAVVVLVADPDGRPRVAGERMWAAGRRSKSEGLWSKALGGADGPLLDPPVLALPVHTGNGLVGMLCVELPERLDGRPARVADLTSLARILVEIVVHGPRERPPVGIAVIHRAADPAAAFAHWLATAHGNLSQMARILGCTRKALYAAAERHGVRLVRRMSRR